MTRTGEHGPGGFIPWAHDPGCRVSLVHIDRPGNAVNKGKKKMTLRGILLGSAVAIMLPTAAIAAPEGFYVGAGAGVNWTRDSDLNLQSTGGELDASFKVGGIGDLSVGYATAAGPRAELEFAWRWRNSIDSTESATPALRDLDGRYRSIAFMGNILYDTNTGTSFTPYIGVGAGIAQVHLKVADFSDKDWVFAYQGIAGVAYNITNNLALTVDYRYFATVDPKFDLGGVTTKGEYGNHTVLAGLRYSFGAPAAAPGACAGGPGPGRPAAAADRVSGVLRLGQGQHHPGVGQDHQRCRRRRRQGARRQHPCDRPHRHLRVAGLQPEALRPPRRRGEERADRQGRPRQPDHRRGQGRDPAPGSHRSERPRAVEPPRADPHPRELIPAGGRSLRAGHRPQDGRPARRPSPCGPCPFGAGPPTSCG